MNILHDPNLRRILIACVLAFLAGAIAAWKLFSHMLKVGAKIAKECDDYPTDESYDHVQK